MQTVLILLGLKQYLAWAQKLGQIVNLNVGEFCEKSFYFNVIWYSRSDVLNLFHYVFVSQMEIRFEVIEQQTSYETVFIVITILTRNWYNINVLFSFVVRYYLGKITQYPQTLPIRNTSSKGSSNVTMQFLIVNAKFG